MSLRENYQKGDLVTWMQVHNLIPFIAGLIVVIGVFMILSNRIELQAQRLESEASVTAACMRALSTLEKRVEMQGLDVRALQTQTTVKSSSTAPQTRILPTLTPGGPKQ